MLSYLLQLLQRLRSRPVVSVLVVALILLIATVLLASFVRWLRRRREERPENWVGIVVSDKVQ